MVNCYSYCNVNLANKLGIDLIMYGEDGEVEYSSTSETQNKFYTTTLM